MIAESLLMDDPLTNMPPPRHPDIHIQGLWSNTGTRADRRVMMLVLLLVMETLKVLGEIAYFHQCQGSIFKKNFPPQHPKSPLTIFAKHLITMKYIWSYSMTLYSSLQYLYFNDAAWKLSFKGPVCRFRIVWWSESTLQAMLMLITVFCHPTWSRPLFYQLWCQAKIRRPKQIHVLGHCRNVVAQYCQLLTSRIPSYVNINAYY